MNIVDRFWELRSSERREITKRLGLINKDDMKTPEAERYKQALIRARDRGLLDALERAIAEREWVKRNK